MGQNALGGVKMKKIDFGWIKIVSFVIVALLVVGCASFPKNNLHVQQRSMDINSVQDEDAIMAKVRIERLEQGDANVTILHLRGTPYEMGFQHGKLMEKEIKELYNIFCILKIFAEEDMMDEVFDLVAPYIAIEEIEEMRGLAHGADIPLRVIHWFHVIPAVAEYGPKMRFRNNFKATSCSNIVAFDSATLDGEIYQMRILDWIRDLGAQKYSTIMVHEPDRGNASVTFSFAGFIGSVSGMNDKQMAFGEMGYLDPPGEDLRGLPFVFLFRKLQRETSTIEEAIEMIKSTTRTNSYVYMISDAKEEDPFNKAKLVIADRQRVKVYTENIDLDDELGKAFYPAIDDIVYGGHYAEVLYSELTKYHGKITPEVLMEIAKPTSMKSNMQNVIFKPSTLEVWVSNASMEKGQKGRACFQPWFYFNLKEELEK